MLGHLHLPLPCTLPVGVSYPHSTSSSYFFFSSRRRHTRLTCDWSSDVCSSDLALIPLLESPDNGDPAAKRLPIGNLLNRAVGCVLGLLLLDRIGPLMVSVEPDPARAAADFHTLFNFATALLFLPLLGPFAWVLTRLLPARAVASDPARSVYLDETARETPALALAGAAREALRMADVTEAMLRGALDALDRGDRKQLAATKGLDNVLDRL